MVKLVTLVGQHLDEQLPTAVTQATTWLETMLAHVKLQECGPGVNLPVEVCCKLPITLHVCMCIVDEHLILSDFTLSEYLLAHNYQHNSLWCCIVYTEFTIMSTLQSMAV